MNIYFRELKAHWKAITIWSLAMILFVIMGMQKYTSMLAGDDVAEEMLELINSMPKFLQVMWGVSTLDITTPLGYFGVVISYLFLMSAIHSSMLGANIISKEERDKTVEFLMTKPVSRKTIMSAKIGAALTNIIIFNIVTIITSFIVLISLKAENIIHPLFISSIAMFLIQLIFMVLGVYLASAFKHPRKSSMIMTFIIMGTFFLSFVIDLNDNFKILTILTPFKYFEAKEFFISGHLNLGFVLLTIAIVLLILKDAYHKYEERDLNL